MRIMEYANTFVTEDYFIAFLGLMIVVLIGLILALAKTRRDFYAEMSNKEFTLEDELLKKMDEDSVYNYVNEVKQENKEEDIYSMFDTLEANEEENAVISTEELERRRQEKFDSLGVSDNEAMIQKYEEDQEKKAIISYEQLLKNASNITLSYSEEEISDKNAPKINKIEVEVKEVSEAQSYATEEEFLSILKTFRASLPN